MLLSSKSSAGLQARSNGPTSTRVKPESMPCATRSSNTVFLTVFASVSSRTTTKVVDLDEDQYLEVYQAMCRKAGKTVHPDIDFCLVELKRKPFVNILDFVDSFRTG